MANPDPCPFCGFKSDGEYAIQLHIEEHHTEDSPFVVNEGTSPPLPHRPAPNNAKGDDGNLWTKCTRPGCGEYVLITDVDDHLELHEATAAAESEQESGKPKRHQCSSKAQSSEGRLTTPSSSNTSLRDVQRSPRKLEKYKVPARDRERPRPSLLDYFSGTSSRGPPPSPQRRRGRAIEPRQPGRLGRRELGPHAFEKLMPGDVRRHLLNDALPYHTQRIGPDGCLKRESIIENETRGIVRVLSHLCFLDRRTEATYLCDPSVKHIVKLRCDGNFCGYWNIQMLLSYLQRGTERTIPHVLQIQDTIEQAWDNGICSYGRVETGGVRGTRKWIGTHEALAYFTQVGVEVEALSFREEENSDSSSSGSNPHPAVIALLDHVEAYFMSGLETSRTQGTSHVTALSPIYFQRKGHSMTIVGLERKIDGGRTLLVFDPSFATTTAMDRLLDGRSAGAAPETLLRAYRRSDEVLSRWEEFEIVVPKASR